jgi:chromosome segregation ATPase
VEALRWSTADELKSKTREIEQSRHEMRNMSAERDDSLERQRVELTELYENMLHDRENTFLKQEENICHQVQLLEKRFQSLTNDNTRLKSDGSQLQRACEKLTNELASKEEKCNQLLWQVDDTSRKLQDTEDTLCKKIQSIESENENYQNTLDQMTAEHTRELDKVPALARNSNNVMP